jgi:hypothetical protein
MEASPAFESAIPPSCLFHGTEQAAKEAAGELKKEARGFFDRLLK